MISDEMTVISGCLRTPGRHETRLLGLKPEWYGDKALRAWWTVVRVRPLTFRSAPRFLQTVVKNPILRESMQASLVRLEAMEAPQDADVDEAARGIADRAKKATILDRARWILESVQADKIASAEEAVKVLAAELASHDPMRESPTDLGDLADQVVAQYHAAQTTPGGGYIKTGIREIDCRAGGARRGEMWILGGFTGDGKTTLAANMMWNAWMNGANGLMVPREMVRLQVGQAFTVRHSAFLRPEAPLVAARIVSGTMTSDEETLLRETRQDIKAREGKTAGRIKVWRAPRKWSILDLGKYVEGMKYQMSLDFMCVDMLRQLGPIRSRGGDNGAREELNDTLGEAKQLACDYNGSRGLWLLAPHQVSRSGPADAAKRKPNPHYIVNDLQDSSRAEQDADVVALLLRTTQLRKAKEAILSLPKIRGNEPCPLGFKVMADYAHALIDNLVPDESAPTMQDFDPVQ